MFVCMYEVGSQMCRYIYMRVRNLLFIIFFYFISLQSSWRLSCVLCTLVFMELNSIIVNAYLWNCFFFGFFCLLYLFFDYLCELTLKLVEKSNKIWKGSCYETCLNIIKVCMNTLLEKYILNIRLITFNSVRNDVTIYKKNIYISILTYIDYQRQHSMLYTLLSIINVDRSIAL